MTPTPKESASDREILLVGPYGVLGTGVIDAVAARADRDRRQVVANRRKVTVGPWCAGGRHLFHHRQ